MKQVELEVRIARHSIFLKEARSIEDLQKGDGRPFSSYGENLEGLDFRNACLVSANFTKSNLMKARFEGADLTDAYFYGAKLWGATYNCDTKFPEGFNPKRRGMILVPLSPEGE